jgi:hypothetical protein
MVLSLPVGRHGPVVWLSVFRHDPIYYAALLRSTNSCWPQIGIIFLRMVLDMPVPVGVMTPWPVGRNFVSVAKGPVAPPALLLDGLLA